MDVTATAAATPGGNIALVWLNQISQHPPGFINDHCSLRHRNDHVLTLSPGTPAAAPRTPGFSFKDMLIPKVAQCRQTTADFKNHIASATTVTTVRSAARHVFFPAKTGGSVTATAGNNFNFSIIHKHSDTLLQNKGTVLPSPRHKGTQGDGSFVPTGRNWGTAQKNRPLVSYCLLLPIMPEKKKAVLCRTAFGLLSVTSRQRLLPHKR